MAFLENNWPLLVLLKELISVINYFRISSNADVWRGPKYVSTHHFHLLSHTMCALW